MSTIIFATMPITGHINPGLPIARELLNRGHKVIWYTGKKYQKAIESSGAEFASASAFEKFDDSDIDAAMPKRARLAGIDQLKFDLKHLFTDHIPASASELLDISKRHGAASIVIDTAFGAGPVVTELGGPPCIAYGITALPLSSEDTAPFGLGLLPDASPQGRLRNKMLNWMSNNVIFKDVRDHNNKTRAKLGLPPTDVGLFDGVILGSKLYLQGTVSEFEYPRSNMPSHVKFIGPLLPSSNGNTSVPEWWDEVTNASRPVIHVSQGTIATNPEQLIMPAISALADQDVLVVVSSRSLTKYARKHLPANVRVADFLPYNELMKHISLFVTNGGYGGVHFALAHGVPIVVAGATEDKPEVANRVEWSGAGFNLRTNSPTPSDVRLAVRRVLKRDSYKRTAQRLADIMAQHDAPRHAADYIETMN